MPALSPARRHLGALAVALLLDAAFGEPPAALHPVVWIGRFIRLLERHAPRGAPAQLTYGTGMALLVPTTAAALAGLGERMTAWLGARAGWPACVVEAVLLKPAFAARMLLDAGHAVQVALACGDVAAARRALRALVSRDVTALEPPLLAAAAVESLGENASDALVAPLLWYAVAGLRGAWAYRAINTADAVVGYHGRYEWLGKAAARVDDGANVLPARLTAMLLVLAAALCGGDAAGAWRVLRRDSACTASPNAGRPMAALAGALGVRLEKVGQYVLNPPGVLPDAATIAAARRIAAVAMALGAGVAATLLAACGQDTHAPGAGLRRRGRPATRRITSSAAAASQVLTRPSRSR
jgi:adenosylcobinamide-phosphate synthase